VSNDNKSLRELYESTKDKDEWFKKDPQVTYDCKQEDKEIKQSQQSYNILADENFESLRDIEKHLLAE
jgi:hypothetical protein